VGESVRDSNLKMTAALRILLISTDPKCLSHSFATLPAESFVLFKASNLEDALAIQRAQQLDLVIGDMCSLTYSDEIMAQYFGFFSAPSLQQLMLILPFFDEKRISNGLNHGVNQCLIAPIDSLDFSRQLLRFNKSSRQTLVNGAFYKSIPDENPFPVCRINNKTLDIIYANPAFHSKINKLQTNKKSELFDFIGEGINKHKNKHQVGYEHIEIGKKRYQLTFAPGSDYCSIYFGDLTALKEAEALFTEKEILHKAILDNIPADIGVFDKDMQYLYVNPNGIKNEQIRTWIIGKTDEDYIALRNPSNLAPFERRKKAFAKAIAEARSVIWLDEYPNESGVTYIKRTVHPVFDEFGQLELLIGYGNDITDMVLAENSIKNLAHELSLQNEGLRRFAYIISHDLRAPSINLKTLLDLYQEDQPDHPKNAEIIKRLKISAERINDTLNDLLEVTRVKDKAQAEPKSECNIQEIWKSCLGDQAQQLQSIGAQIQEQFCDLNTLFFNRMVLNSVFTNLISNAIKYRSAERSLHLKITTTRKSEWYEIRIADNGIGLDIAKFKNRIFSLYQRFHSHVEGKGLGLFLVRSQLESMGSKLSIESKVGIGTTFIISIPI
jgi:signal transduction histidine kinase